MKTPDLTKPVMQKIVNYEKKRTSRWLKLFFGVIFVLLLIAVIVTVVTIKQMIDSQIFDMFTLFQEDREIISEFWQDTLATIWAVMPERLVILTALALITIILIIIFTHGRRKIIKKKLSELAKYK